MSEVEGGRKLEGLARSIDALFSSAGWSDVPVRRPPASESNGSGAPDGHAAEEPATLASDGLAAEKTATLASDGLAAEEAATLTSDGLAAGEAATLTSDGHAADETAMLAPDGHPAEEPATLSPDGSDAPAWRGAPLAAAADPSAGAPSAADDLPPAAAAPVGPPAVDDLAPALATAPVPPAAAEDLASLDPFLELGEPPRDSDGGSVPEATFGTPEGLAVVVEEYLGAPPPRRAGRAAHLAKTAASLLRAGGDPLPPDTVTGLADAAERLSAALGAPAGEAALEPIRSLLVPSVAKELVARLCAEREEGRRDALITICRRFAPEMSDALARALADADERFARRACLDAVVAMGEASLPVVESMLGDERWFVVRNAVTVLGDVGGGRAVELLTGALAHSDPRVRREGLMSLTKLGGEDAGLLAYGMLGDHDATVRQAAAVAAGSLKVERALKPLIKMLETEDDPDVIPGVLRALGQLGDPGAVHAIEKHAVGRRFKKPPDAVRIAAYQALHHIGTPHARKLLAKAKGDKSAAVRAAIRELE